MLLPDVGRLQIDFELELRDLARREKAVIVGGLFRGPRLGEHSLCYSAHVTGHEPVGREVYGTYCDSAVIGDLRAE